MLQTNELRTTLIIVPFRGYVALLQLNETLVILGPNSVVQTY